MAEIQVRPEQETLAVLTRAILLASLLLVCGTRAWTQVAPASKPSHAFRGTVRKVDATGLSVVVDNDNIPHWMPPMTMSYHVSNPEVLRTLKAGDHVSATVYDGDVKTLYRLRVIRPSQAERPLLPPVSYVCSSPGEEGIIDDRPGTCPKSGHALVAIRLAIAYSCLRGPRFIQEHPGTCAYDKSPLVPVTASMFWLCGDSDRRYLSPARCEDGAPSAKHFEVRPHGDHNPRHGGISVFMSDDLLHHVEGTFVAPGVFRAYFYDEYTRPLRVAGFSAQVAAADNNAAQTGPAFALVRSTVRDGNMMEVRVPGAAIPTKTSPLNFILHVIVAQGAKDWVTDYHFDAYSREPAAPDPNVRPPAKPFPSVDPLSAGLPFTTKQAPLPSDISALLALLEERSASFESLLRDGNLTAVWYPAIGSKDVALELEAQHGSELSDSRATELRSALQRLTLAAWQIDAAGDLGNKPRLLELEREFMAAVSDIERLYAAAR